MPIHSPEKRGQKIEGKSRKIEEELNNKQKEAKHKDNVKMRQQINGIPCLFASSDGVG